MLALVVGLVSLALLFNFLNGMNDAANSIATVVSTRVLSPRLAVIWAAFFNFAAVFLFGVHVASTIGTGVVDPKIVTPTMLLATLVGAIAWTYLCTRVGLPISVSHALVGALVGSALVKAGPSALIVPGLVKIVIFIVLAPLIGMALGAALIIAVMWVCRRAAPGPIDRWFRRLQLASAALYSLGHGANDAQKTMGIIAGVLFTVPAYRALVTDAGGQLMIPFWVVLLAHAAIGLGTLSGGWRIIHTMGSRITKLQPVHGFAAESGAAAAVFLATVLGIPVSTTHAITGSIVGVGATRRLSAVRWGVAGRIVWAWVLTIPAAALLGMGMQSALGLFGIR